MSNSNKNKTDFLGMNIGTAQNRLRKMLLYDAIKKLGENKCYRCEELIDKIDELSIDHKKPWLHESIELFWSLENIAYSHLSCNSSAARNAKKITSPEGMSWCCTCQGHKPVAEFSKGRRDGLYHLCRKCSYATVKERRIRTGHRY